MRMAGSTCAPTTCCTRKLDLASNSALQSVGAGMVWGGGVLLFILGSNLGGVGPERGLQGDREEEGGGVRSVPGSARTILLSHIISARPPKEPLMVSYGT